MLSVCIEDCVDFVHPLECLGRFVSCCFFNSFFVHTTFIQNKWIKKQNPANIAHVMNFDEKLESHTWPNRVLYLQHIKTFHNGTGSKFKHAHKIRKLENQNRPKTVRGCRKMRNIFNNWSIRIGSVRIGFTKNTWILAQWKIETKNRRSFRVFFFFFFTILANTTVIPVLLFWSLISELRNRCARNSFTSTSQ